MTSRKKYRDHIDTKCAAFRVNIDTVLNDAMSQVLQETYIQKGIAKTKGLKENIFLTWLCTAVRMPLMIIGPPGSSKTLAVNIVINNSKGKESQKLFYRNRPQLRATHYQCSKLSTDVEIKAAFDRAINTQKCVDKEKVQCIVFMDEAGLPEEQRESLKVLHYYTGGHMSTKADVAFVAVSNHVLDAAKSNRVITLHRAEPDIRELKEIAHGILLTNNRQIYEPAFSTKFKWEDIIDSLCKTYRKILNCKKSSEFDWFKFRFGLRDFIFILYIYWNLLLNTLSSK